MIAAAVTFLFALLVFLILFKGSITFDRRQLAEASIPEIGQEEELFIDPMLIEPGEDFSKSEDDAAPEAQGNPEVKAVEEDISRPAVKGENPEKTPAKEKLVSQKKESSVKTTEPSAKEKEIQKARSKSNAFQNPGVTDGKKNASGPGGTSTGISGDANGWKFLGCPAPQVSLSSKKTITVSITVNADGKVTSARASGGDPKLHAACEAAARQARWQPLNNGKGKTARGKITFVITPD